MLGQRGGFILAIVTTVANIRGFFSYNGFIKKIDVFVKFDKPQRRSAMPVRQRPIVNQHGVALIEVMIAFLLLSVGLIGYSALQVRATKATQSSLQRTDASILANNIIESMRANKSWAVDPSRPYNLASGTCSVPPTDGTLIKNDLNTWFLSLQATFGANASTCADITCTDSNSAAPGTCTVNIFWNDSRALGGLTNQNIQLVGRL